MTHSAKGTPGKILCVGSLHYDILVESPRIPRLGETVAASRWMPKFGGKGGNQIVAAAKSGASTRMLGAVGDDSFGGFILAHLRAAGVDSSNVRVLRGPTGMSVAISEFDGEYGAAIVSGVNLDTKPASVDSPDLWNDVALLMLQNEVPVDLNVAAASAARRQGATVCLNAAPYRELPEKLACNIDVLVVNAIEAEEMINCAISNASEARAAAAALAAEFGSALVTVGDQGVGLAQRESGSHVVPAKRVEVRSAHGAGDVFTGTLCAELVKGVDLLAAATVAAERAADHVAQAG